MQTIRPFLAIMCCKHRQDRADSQRDTWLQDMPEGFEYKFFFGRGMTREPLNDEVFVDCCDDYRSLPHKVQLAVRWAVDQKKYSHIIKMDDDVYARPERLLLSGFEKHDHIGFSFKQYGPVGLAYWLSAKAANCVADAPEPTIQAEDSWVNQVLRLNNIPFYHDPRYLLVLTTHLGRPNTIHISPRAENNLIAVAEFKDMHDPHRVWNESVAEYNQILQDTLL